MQAAPSPFTLPLGEESMLVYMPSFRPVHGTPAPRVFTKILCPVVGWLRLQGVQCMIYVDYLLIIADSSKKAAKQCAAAVSLLESLGELHQVSDSTSAVIDISGPGCGFMQNKIELSLSENFSDKDPSTRPPHAGHSLHQEVSSVHRQTLGSDTCNSPSTTSLLKPATSQALSTQNEQGLRPKYSDIT